MVLFVRFIGGVFFSFLTSLLFVWFEVKTGIGWLFDVSQVVPTGRGSYNIACCIMKLLVLLLGA